MKKRPHFGVALEVGRHVLAAGSAPAPAEVRRQPVGRRRYVARRLDNRTAMSPRRRPSARLDGVRLLTDGDELRARERRVQVVGELRVALVAHERAEVVEPEVAGDVHRVGALAEDVVGVAVGLVDPAHVLRDWPGDDHVVADHGLGRHVAEVGFLKSVPASRSAPEVRHVELVGVLRDHLVEQHDQDPLRCRPPVRLDVFRCGILRGGSPPPASAASATSATAASPRVARLMTPPSSVHGARRSFQAQAAAATGRPARIESVHDRRPHRCRVDAADRDARRGGSGGGGGRPASGGAGRGAGLPAGDGRSRGTASGTAMSPSVTGGASWRRRSTRWPPRPPRRASWRSSGVERPDRGRAARSSRYVIGADGAPARRAGEDPDRSERGGRSTCPGSGRQRLRGRRA